MRCIRLCGAILPMIVVMSSLYGLSGSPENHQETVGTPESTGESARGGTDQQPVERVDSPPGLSGVEAEDLEQGRRFSELLQTLDDLLLSPTVSSGEEVKEMYNRVRPALRDRSLLVIFDGDSLSGVEKLSSVYFSLTSENEDDALSEDVSRPQGYLVVNPALFEVANLYPSLALSLVVETFAHANNFLKLGQEFAASYSQPVERYLYSMDALYIQTLFISRYLKGSYTLSGYEEYLLQGLEVDKLASVSLFLRGVDQDIVYSLIEHNKLVREGSLSLEEYLEKILDLIDLLWRNFIDSQDEYAQATQNQLSGDDLLFAARRRYIATVSTGTFLKYGVGVINQLLSAQQEEIASDQAIVSLVEEVNEDSSLLYQEFSSEQRDVSPYRRYFLQDLVDLGE